MYGLKCLSDRVNEPVIARIGAALWSRVGARLEPSDLSWASGVLGNDGKELLWCVLMEQEVVDREGRISGSALARMLELLCRGTEEEYADLKIVWTLPMQHPDAEVLGSSYRGALLKAIDASQEELMITSPFLEESGVNCLTQAVLRALSRNVEITVITCSANDIGSYQSKALENLRREAVGRGKKMRVFSICEKANFIFHAKIVVSDAKHFVVGSANVTGRGLGGHVECGVSGSGPQAEVIANVLSKTIESGIAYLVFSTI